MITVISGFGRRRRHIILYLYIEWDVECVLELRLDGVHRLFGRMYAAGLVPVFQSENRRTLGLACTYIVHAS